VLEPGHAEAQVALGVFHAEVVDKLGPLAARLTHGASRDAALRHFDAALRLAPGLPVVALEYARALRALAPRETARRRELLQGAIAIEPADAMEALDIEAARADLRHA
jgi:cytochrome c-type biogenesis protein CcmH/NrfG